MLQRILDNRKVAIQIQYCNFLLRLVEDPFAALEARIFLFMAERMVKRGEATECGVAAVFAKVEVLPLLLLLPLELWFRWYRESPFHC